MIANVIRTIVVMVVLSLPRGFAVASRADDHYAIAAGHYANHQWPLALDEFDSYVREHPQHEHAADARFFAGEALVQLRRFKPAMSRFQEFLGSHESHPFAARALFRWGECAYFSDDRVQAMRLLRQFQSRHPNHTLNEFALPYLGNLLLETGDSNGAKQAYELALKKFSGGSQADDCVVQLAILAYRDGRHETAQEHLTRLRSDFPDSPHLAEAAYWNGMILFQRSAFERAAASFQEVLRLDDQHERASACLYFVGESWRRHGDMLKATDAFQRVLRRTSDDEWSDDALTGLVRICLLNSDFSQLDRYFSSLEANFAERDRMNEARQLYGESLIKRDEYDKAIRIFESLTDLGATPAGEAGAKSTAINRYLLAVAQLGADQPEAARDTLQRIRLDGLSSYFRCQVHLAKASAASDLGEFLDVDEEMRDALASQPPDSLANRCHYTLIRALVKLNRLRESEAAFADWSRRSPVASDLRRRAARQIAESAFEQEEYQVALRYFSHVLSDVPPGKEHAQCLTGRGWCYFQLENHAEAVKAFEQLIRQYPRCPETRAARLARSRSLQLLDRHEDALAAYLAIAADSSGGDDFVVASLAAAEIYEITGRADDAERLLQTLMDHPDSAAQIDQVLYRLGWTLIRMDRISEGLSHLQRVHDDYPESRYWTDATYRVAERAFQAGDHRRARLMLNRIHSRPVGETDTNILPHALHLEGRIAADRRQWRDVIPPLERLLDEYPLNPLVDSTRYWLAEAHFKLADYDAAERLLRLITTSADVQQDWRGMVLLRQSQISAVRKEWSKVNKVLASLSEAYPDFQRMYEADFVRGRTHAARGEYREARELFNAVVEDPRGRFTVTAAMAQWMIGETYMHQSDYEHALRAYMKVETLYDYPQWRAAALLQAGKCCERLEQTGYAVRLYRRLNDLPKSPYHAAAAQRLRRLGKVESREVYEESPDGETEREPERERDRSTTN